MVLGLTPSEMFEQIGHDGSEIVNDLPEPLCRRAFNVQECINVAVRNLSYPVEFMVECENVPYWDEVVKPYVFSNRETVDHYLSLVPGVLLGFDHRTKAHAVAWCREEQICYDPIGYKCPLTDFHPRVFFGVF